MIRNYFRTTWRNFRKNVMLSMINLGGLSIGIAAVLLIGIYIYSETGFDNFQKNRSSLYRVGFRFWQGGKLLGDGAVFTPPFGPDAKEEFAEIKGFTRISSERLAYITYNDKTLKVENIHHADTSFFQLFSFKLLQGDALTALREPYSIILTNETARKLFGTDENVIGKVVRLDNQTNYIVTGIAEPAPVNSHLTYNALLSFSTLYKEPGNFMDWNGGEQYLTYLQLKNGVNKASFENKLPAFMWKHVNRDYTTEGFKIDAFLQPLGDIHLHYSDNSESLRTNIYVFSIIALLILVISCVNYVNLTTAQAMTRFKEIGVRKVLGARRLQLIKQFLSETVATTTIAFVIALGIVKFLTPAYQQIIGRDLPPINATMVPTLLFLFIVVMGVGIIAGSYVAFYLSAFNATRIFKALLPQSGQTKFRKALIVAQFVITIALVACTFIISVQLNYSRRIDTGLDKNHILILPLVGKSSQQAYPVLQQGLVQIQGVQQSSGLSEIPYDGITTNGFIPEGDTKAITIHQLDADENFPKTFNAKMVAGEYFSKNRPTLKDGYVINETLAKTLGWQNPVGKTISRNGEHKVIGVVKDFHFASLHDKIEPLIITNKPWEGNYSYLAVKYQARDLPAFINNIRQKWSSISPGAAFDYWFLDDAFNTIYKGDEKFQRIFTTFSSLSIILSLAGIFGLVTLSIKQRTKELGIRKVLGAGVKDVIRITVTDFARLIILATVIAAPIAWYYINQWLQNFSYRVNIHWWEFAISGLAILIVAVGIVSAQSIKASVANPMKSLRTE